MDMEQNDKHKFLFNVDILIEEENNGRALEKLLHLLNTKEIQDYMIKEGIELGKSIEIALRESINKKKMTFREAPAPKQEAKTSAKGASAQPSDRKDANSHNDQHQLIWEQFQQFKQNNTLIRLTAVKGKGVKLSIPCRILNVDTASSNVSVYHVDEKQVYLFNINEIDDFVVTS